MEFPLRLSLTTGQSALLVSTGGYAVPFIAVSMGFKDLDNKLVDVLMAAVWLAAFGLAIWWMFHKLRALYTRRQARAIATAFGVSTPVALVSALVLSEISGGYGEWLIGHAWGGLAGAFVGTVAITALLNFIVCWIVLTVTRLTISLEGSPR
jgi:hypothetical protein